MATFAPIALFWFFYFGALGIFFPFYSLYLRENAGLSGSEVGLVLAALPFTGLIAQPLWGNLADRSGARSTVLCLLTFATAAAYWLLGRASGFPALLLATSILALFATAVVPMSVSVALAAFGRSGSHSFGLARVWGTVGYLIAVASFPSLLDWQQARVGSVASQEVSEPGLELMFPIIACIITIAATAAIFLPRRGAVTIRAERGDWRTLGSNRPAVLVFAVVFFSFVFLQGPMALFPILVRARGGDLQSVGQLWIVMLLLEIPLIALSGTWMNRLGARALLSTGIVCGGIRWLVCGSAASDTLFYAVQILHGLTVAGLMVGAPLYLEQVVPERLRSTAQSLLAMFGIGLGGLLSNIATGWLIDHAGNQMPYLIGGTGALLLGSSLAWILPAPTTASTQEASNARLP